MMAIIGIERLIYCVDDPALTVRFFEDFGLSIYNRTDDSCRFDLPDNSRIYIQDRARSPVPGSQINGQGVHEIVWGTDSLAHLEKLVGLISMDRDVRRGDDGIVHFVADGGLAMGLRYWPEKRLVQASTDPVNSPGHVNRMNVHRRWITRARPKSLSHVVFISPNYEATFAFMRDRLGFRLSDLQRGLGLYFRCDGTNDHHNMFLLNANSGFPGTDGTLRFHHVNFTVTDLDEIMAGKNYMERKGWARSVWGLGRHRIASALFLYLPCPGGGEAEYGADSDALDASWIPRDFSPAFGLAHWMHDMPEWWLESPEWDVTFGEPNVLAKGAVSKHADLPSAQIELLKRHKQEDRLASSSVVADIDPSADSASLITK